MDNPTSLKFCYDKNDEDSSKAEMALSRIKLLSANTETEHQLRSNQLSDLLPYVKKPSELVIKIYSVGQVGKTVILFSVGILQVNT